MMSIGNLGIRMLIINFVNANDAMDPGVFLERMPALRGQQLRNQYKC